MDKDRLYKTMVHINYKLENNKCYQNAIYDIYQNGGTLKFGSMGNLEEKIGAYLNFLN